MTTPGDERSRTNPGHGYPESTEHFLTYSQVFTSKSDFEKALKDIGQYEVANTIGVHVTEVFRL